MDVGSDRMEEGDAVVLFNAKSRFNAVFLTQQKKIRVFGILKDLSCLVGQPYGSVYELSPATDRPERLLELKGRQAAELVSDGRDNRDVLDAAGNQKLSMDEIEDLKANAESGNEIVEALIENSQTFDRKTEFAQEKYLSKKVNKYCTTFSALRPSTVTVSETQFDWFAAKAGFLRVDALSIMLSLANVSAHQRVLVVDNCMGLIAAAVVERLGGYGNVCVGFFGKKASKLESLKRFRPDLPSNLHRLPLADLIDLKAQYRESMSRDEVVAMPVYQRLLKRGSVSSETLLGWLERGFDSCLLADWKVDPAALVEGVLPLLAPSASFAMYGSGMASLAQCQHRLCQRKDVVLVELQDLWWREYQVLSGRTRPMMDAKCPGGYVLSGVKVHFEEPLLDGAALDGAERQSKIPRLVEEEQDALIPG